MHAEMYLNQMAAAGKDAGKLLNRLAELADGDSTADAVMADSAIAGIVNASGAMLCVLDPEFTILSATAAFAAHLFRQLPDITGMPIAGFLPPHIADERLTRARLVLESGAPDLFNDFSAGIFARFCYLPVQNQKQQARFLLVCLEEVNDTAQIASHFASAEAKYKEVFNNSRMCAVLLTEHGLMVRVNSAFEAAFELKPLYAAGKPLQQLLHADDVPAYTAALGQAAGGITPQPLFGIRFRTVPGNVMHCALTLTPLVHASGAVREVLAEITDETPLWQAQEMLAWNKFLLEQLPDAMVTTDSSYYVTNWNRSAEAMYGWTAPEAIGMHVDELFRGRFLNTTRKAYNDAIRLTGSWRGEAMHYHKDGKELYISLSISVISNARGDIKEVIAMHRDVTQTRSLQEEVRRSAAEWEATFSAVDDSIMVLSTEKKILKVNHATLQLLQLPEEKVIGTFCSSYQICATLATNLCPFSKALATRKREKAEIEYNGKWFEVTVDLMPEEDGSISKAVHILRDISNHKEAEAQLRSQRAELEHLNSVKDRFISVLAHDLRSPFNGIYNLTDLLHTDYAILGEEERASIIATLRNETSRVYTLLENLLEWGRFQQGRIDFCPAQVKVLQVVRSAMEIMRGIANSKNISLQVDGDPECQLFADTRMLSSMLRNLISNAVKFSPRNGVVDILVNKNSNAMSITVQDYGVGMSPEEQQLLFRPEAMHSEPGTEKERGSGLGLLLVKEFTERHGGTVTVNSKRGAGSAFVIQLPLGSGENQAAPE